LEVLKGDLMDERDEYEHHEPPRYARPEELRPGALRESLSKLQFFGDDLFLRLQAVNLDTVDAFLTGVEYRVLRELFVTEATPPDAHFLDAQSQMWIFAAYEVLRTWHQRAREMVKWAANGGLVQKRDALLAVDDGYVHHARLARIEQLNAVIADPRIVDRLKRDMLHLHVPFTRLEYIRVSMAKHEVSGQPKRAARQPGYGRINMWCGSLDYELENGRYTMGYINRRDIADELRALDLEAEPLDAENLDRFDAFMAGDDFEEPEGSAGS
jgi:hypothetical protein